MTVRQREALAQLRLANQNLETAQIGKELRSRFDDGRPRPTALSVAFRHRSHRIAGALAVGIPAETIADECAIAGTRRIRKIAGSGA